MKKELSARLQQYLRSRVGEGSLVGDVPRIYIHEGDRLRMLRADGTSDESELKEAAGEIQVRREELPALSGKERRAKLDELAGQMTGQIERHLIESMSEITEKYGQTVGKPGAGLTVETVFEAWEKIQTDFDESGNPDQLSFVGSEEAVKRMKEIQQEIFLNPDLRERHSRLVQRKYEDWRERETARKLVG